MQKNDQQSHRLIPELQDQASLNAIADSLESMAKQIRFAAEQVGEKPLEVPSTATFRRSHGFVLNWLGNLFQAVSSMSLAQIAESDSKNQPPVKNKEKRKAVK